VFARKPGSQPSRMFVPAEFLFRQSIPFHGSMRFEFFPSSSSRDRVGFAVEPVCRRAKPFGMEREGGGEENRGIDEQEKVIELGARTAKRSSVRACVQLHLSSFWDACVHLRTDESRERPC